MGVGKNAGGIGGYDVGYICSNLHGRINKWAKYKPVDIGKLEPVTDANLKDLRYGFTIPTISQFNDSAIWVWNNPKGGINSPYRLTDFNNYDTKAIVPMDFNFPELVYANKLNEIAFTFDESMWDGGMQWRDSISIGFYDLFDRNIVGDTYPCIVLINKTRGTFKYKTTERTLSDLDSTDDKELFFDIPTADISKDENIEVWACLSKKKDTSGNNSPDIQGGVIISLECASKYSNRSYIVLHDTVVNQIEYISGGFQYRITGSTIWIDSVKFVAKNIRNINTNNLTFTANVRVNDYNGAPLVNTVWGRYPTNFLPNEQKEISIYNASAPMYFDFSNQPLKGEIELLLEILLTDGTETWYFYEDISYPFS